MNWARARTRHPGIALWWLFALSPAATAAFASATPAPAPPGGCAHPVLAIGDQGLRTDARGRAHAAYVGDAVFYAREDDAAWRIETVAPPPATIYEGTYQPLPALALDPDGAPHLAFLDPTNRAVRYAERGAGGWALQTVARAAPGKELNYETAIALDRARRPHIVYAENGTLRHAAWTGSGWADEPIDDRGWMEMYFSLAIDGADVPHVSYFAAAGKTGVLKYAVRVEGRWRAEFVDRAGFLGEFNSLALGPDGAPFISYLDTTHGQIKVAHRTAPYRWSIARVDAGQWFGGFTSIAVGPDGRPRVSYTGVANQARYAESTGAGWAVRPLDDDVWYTALALDGGGAPRVVYFSRAARQLRSAHWDGAQWIRQRIDAPTCPATPERGAAPTS